MGRALSASLALNAPASFFFLRDEVLLVMRKTGRWEQAPFLSEQCWPVFALVQDKERLGGKRHNLVLSYFLSQWGQVPSLN